jgi:hypothetical protein
MQPTELRRTMVVCATHSNDTMPMRAKTTAKALAPVYKAH